MGNAIQRINRYPADSLVCFVNTHLLDSDLSSDLSAADSVMQPSNNRGQMFTLFSGRPVGVPLAAPYWAKYFDKYLKIGKTCELKLGEFSELFISYNMVIS